MRLCDLEEKIMRCWQVTEDVNALYEYLMDDVEYGKIDSDQIANVLLGIKELYDIKFNFLFNAYEQLLKNNIAK